MVFTFRKCFSYDTNPVVSCQILVAIYPSMSWNVIPLWIMWTIWKEQNSHTFEGIEQAMTD